MSVEARLKCLELAVPFSKARGLTDCKEVVSIASEFYKWVEQTPEKPASTLSLKEPSTQKRKP